MGGAAQGTATATYTEEVVMQLINMMVEPPYTTVELFRAPGFVDDGTSQSQSSRRLALGTGGPRQRRAGARGSGGKGGGQRYLFDADPRPASELGSGARAAARTGDGSWFDNASVRRAQAASSNGTDTVTITGLDIKFQVIIRAIISEADANLSPEEQAAKLAEAQAAAEAAATARATEVQEKVLSEDAGDALAGCDGAFTGSRGVLIFPRFWCPVLAVVCSSTTESPLARREFASRARRHSFGNGQKRGLKSATAKRALRASPNLFARSI